MSDIEYAYAGDITKFERDATGDLLVYGKATGPDLDLDGQICDPAWLAKAMPDWFEWGNVREMHGPVLAGVGKELTADGDSWMLKSKCIDPVAAMKIEEGGYKGYSVGIKDAKVVKDAAAPGGRIVGGSIVEISYVDRPCNPDATMTICKAVTAGKSAALQPVDTAGGLLEGIEDWPVEDLTGEDEPADEDPKPLTEAEHAKAVDLVKTIGPDGNLDEQPDIEGGQQAITLIAKLIGYEATELAAGRLGESYDISLLVQAVECLKSWLSYERSAQAGQDGDGGMPDMDGITFVGLMAKYLSTADELDELAGNLPDIAKKDYSAQERRDAASEGTAMPDGSFPIKSKDDLTNAIRLAGHAKDPAAAKAHIIKRAKALGATDMIPDSWKNGSKDAEPDTTKTTDADTVSKGDLAEVVKTAVSTAVTEATEPLKEQVKAMSEDNATLKAELAKVQATAVPGGPVRRATTATGGTGEQVDKAARYREIAANTTDLNTKRAYQALADEEDAAAAK